jgi:hypothetical protein
MVTAAEHHHDRITHVDEVGRLATTASTDLSRAFSSTEQPAVRSSGLASSISLWLIPPTQGINTIAVRATRAM